jgi:hypothetical protein
MDRNDWIDNKPELWAEVDAAADRAAALFQALGWDWFDAKRGIPSAREIKIRYGELVLALDPPRIDSAGSGRLTVRAIKEGGARDGWITIEFGVDVGTVTFKEEQDDA